MITKNRKTLILSGPEIRGAYTGASILNNIIKEYYNGNHEYHYYYSVFSFVTGADEFNIDLFGREFKSNYKLENGRTLPQYAVLHELDIFNALKMTDDLYQEKTLEMLEFAYQGKYLLAEYQQIYYYCKRFSNPLGLNLNDIGAKLKAAMTQAAGNTDYLSKDATSKLGMQDAPVDNPEIESIRTHGLSIIENLENQREEQVRKNILAEFMENIDSLYNKYHSDDQFKRTIEYTAIFRFIDVDSLVEKLIKCRPFSIYFLSSLLHQRYTKISFQEEAATLSVLNNKLCEYLQGDHKPSLAIWALTEFQQKINAIQNKHGLPTIA